MEGKKQELMQYITLLQTLAGSGDDNSMYDDMIKNSVSELDYLMHHQGRKKLNVLVVVDTVEDGDKSLEVFKSLLSKVTSTISYKDGEHYISDGNISVHIVKVEKPVKTDEEIEADEEIDILQEDSEETEVEAVVETDEPEPEDVVLDVAEFERLRGLSFDYVVNNVSNIEDLGVLKELVRIV